MSDYCIDYKGNLLAGVDEVGRGPLVGDVVAAAVILPKAHTIEGLTDSKKLSEKKREALAEQIRHQAHCYAIGRASAEEIDEINILQASLLAMKRAVLALTLQPEFVIVDGNKLPEWTYPSLAIIKGDLHEPAISAASIIAKVARDRDMIELDKKYPQYGFAGHKGYPTKAHFLALEQFGPLDEHRRSFAPVKRLLALDISE